MNPNKSKFTIYSIIQEILKIKIKVEKYIQNAIQRATELLWGLERVSFISQREQLRPKLSWGVGAVSEIK